MEQARVEPTTPPWTERLTPEQRAEFERQYLAHRAEINSRMEALVAFIDSWKADPLP